MKLQRENSMDNVNDYVADERMDQLIIDEELAPGITLGVGNALRPIQKSFMESYLESKDSVPLTQWLCEKIAEELPDHSAEDVAGISREIIATLKLQEEKRSSLDKAVANGRSKESWFASEAKTATSHMSGQQASQYLQALDDALASSNRALYRTIHTQAGAISQNTNLDGFIAEQYHAQTFNLNAEATGSPYRAKVLEPNGKGYSKNSVDIVIVDENGKVVRRYQSKYCKDAAADAKAFEKGDYRGQQKLVSDGRENQIGKKATNVIEAPDGTTSNPLTKEQAKELQKQAQSGNWNDLNWNEYKTKDLAIGVGKQAGQAALMGAAIGVGLDVAQKVWNGEEIKGEELVETAIVSGADFGIKAAAAGALKVGVEKGFIGCIPKGTPADTIANIAHVGIENVKIIGKIASGEMNAREGLEKMEETTVSTVAGIAASKGGSAIGAAIGSVLGPIGSGVGYFVGGSIGYMAGSKVGSAVIKCAQKIREKTRKALETAKNAITNFVYNITDRIGNFCSSLVSFFC